MSLEEYCSKDDVISKLCMVFSILYNLSIIETFLICVIIRVKKSDDVLQGINKLDWLLKVSVFQIFKNPERQSIKEASFSGVTSSNKE